MARVITLPDRLDSTACSELLPMLIAHRTDPVDLDGSAVSHIGAVGAQLLLAARASWTDPDRFRVTGLQQPALRCLAELGFAPDHVGAVPAGPAP
ncbi:MAG: STAS domain-containing protein [Rhodobacteraceae bacterium]|nr:STAS domain-containing protein [Paracoccaceae bacterium]